MLLKRNDSLHDDLAEVFTTGNEKFRRIYLVKKNPLVHDDCENWILMDQNTFIRFLQTEDGKRRKKDFGQLNACEKRDAIIIAECGEEAAQEWKAELNRQQFLRQRNENSGFQTIHTCLDNDSFSCPCRESWLKDEQTYEGDSMENYILNRVLADELHRKIGGLADDERKLIYDVYFHNKTVSEYAREADMDINRAFYLKGIILDKLRNALETRDETYEKDGNSSDRSGFHYDAKNREMLGGAYEKR